MILLDTHIWVWWVQNDERLKESATVYLDELSPQEIGIGAISYWEVATLHSLRRLSFSTSLKEWMEKAIGATGITVHGIAADKESNEEAASVYRHLRLRRPP